jgi:hypothetical protein
VGYTRARASFELFFGADDAFYHAEGFGAYAAEHL